MPLGPFRDLHGRLLQSVDPARLPYPERVEELRRFAAALQDGKAGDKRFAVHVGQAIQKWLSYGGDLTEYLAVKPPRGSRNTPQRIVSQEEQDRNLVRFANACGTDRTALAVLRGKAPCPPASAALLQDLQDAPKSNAAISRARRRLSHHRP